MSRTQEDHDVRVIALSNLEAMIARHAREDMGSTFLSIHRITASSVHVYMSDRASEGVVVLPSYTSPWEGDSDNPRVVLEITRTYSCYYQDADGIRRKETDDTYLCDRIRELIIDAPKLWRGPWPHEQWLTDEEWKSMKSEAASTGNPAVSPLQ